MNLSLSKQALLLDYIFESGWITPGAVYHDFIKFELIPAIELAITEQLGPGWRLKEAYARLLMREAESAARNQLQKSRRDSRNGLARQSKANRGTSRGNSSSKQGRRQNSKAKNVSKKRY